MGLFPKIQSPCPYKGKIDDILDGETCRLCKKQVFDLTEMDDGGRRQFLAGCEGAVCVRYSVMLRPALAAAVAGASAFALPAAAFAQDSGADAEMVIIVGGMRAPQQAEWVEHQDAVASADLPDLPVIYEDVPHAAASTASAAPGKPAVSASGGI